MSTNATRLLVFSDDWGRHPSSCQYLVREMIHQVDVTWVNTIGMRTPRLDMLTVRRVIGKLKSALKSRAQAPSASIVDSHPVPKVMNPAMWPWFTRNYDRRLNKYLLTQALHRELKSWSSPTVALTTIPIVADLVGVLPVERWVYYCVDDFSVWPGLDQKTMLRMERDLIDKVDQIVVVSEVLQERVRKMGRDSTLLTHGVNLDNWNLAEVSAVDWPSKIETPVALFWGVIDRRLDTDFVVELSRSMQQGSIVFIGPQQNPDPHVFSCKNVFHLPAVSPSELPSFASGANCLIMPYSDSPVTRAMQPLKLKEYLATGKPVVARNLPAVSCWSDACDLVDSPTHFAQSVSHYLNYSTTPDSQIAARIRLCSEAWSNKARVLLQLITQQ